MSRRLVCASANPHKAEEIAEILSDFEVVARPGDLADVVEDGDTLEANARLKAVAVCEHVGADAVADDTGLEVDALNGEPGIYSARFAGENATYEDNVSHLLQRLTGIEDRTARFRTVAVLRRSDGSEVVAQGCCEGRIATSRQGTGGFGYDSVFIPDGSGGLSFAQMGRDKKNAISHRGRALRALAEMLTTSSEARLATDQ